MHSAARLLLRTAVSLILGLHFSSRAGTSIVKGYLSSVGVTRLWLCHAWHVTDRAGHQFHVDTVFIVFHWFIFNDC